jgi:hypothetical protein
MANFIWKILEVDSKDQIIKSAQYSVTATDENNSVETEGHWYFSQEIDKPFADIKEEDVIELIKKETTQFGKNIIEERLQEQLAYLEAEKSKPKAPWLPQTFTAN